MSDLRTTVSHPAKMAAVFLLLAVAPAFGQIDPSIIGQLKPVQIDTFRMVDQIQQARQLQIQRELLRMQQESHAQQMQAGALWLQQQREMQDAQAQAARDASVANVLRLAAPVAPEKPLPAPPSINRAEQKTKGLCNGRWWRDYSTLPDMRLGLLVGMVDGLAAASDESKLYSLVVPGGLTYEESIKALDTFYEDPLNGPIPVVGALQIVKLKAEGKDVPFIDAAISSWRR
jgi:hypothetical protein